MSELNAIKCIGCGIMVGEGHMETRLYQAGDYKICGFCWRQLCERGRLWVRPYADHQHLYRDGHVAMRKLTLGGDEGRDEAERGTSCKTTSSR